MADKKISALTALTAANVAPATDVVPIVDTSATETKKVTAKDLVDGALNGGTANGVLYLNGSKAATSGSALTYSGGALTTTGSFAASDGTNIAEIKINAATLDFNTSSGSVPQVFRLGSSEQMRLTTTGLGIGTSSPRGNLDVGHSNSVASVTTSAHIGYSAANFYSYRITNTVNASAFAAGDFAIERGTTAAWATDLGIDDNGNVTIGGGALATTATNRFLYVPTCAGTPTGTPTAKTGFAPIVVNTTNNKLYFYSGGAWRDAGP